MSKNVVIVGFGVVGKNMKKLFPKAGIIDPALGLSYPQNDWSMKLIWDVAFICVPTPMKPDGSCDTTIVSSAIAHILPYTHTVVIKSTVPPGYTRNIASRLGNKIIFSPEFFGGTQHANAVDYNFVILGALHSDNTQEVVEAYKEIKTGDFQFHITDPTTAELVKYAENSFLATKVAFFNEFYRLSERLGVNVDVFRELLLLDPRIGRSHTFVYRDHPYYDSHCLSKDIPAILYEAESRNIPMDILRAVKTQNDQWKKEYKDKDPTESF